MTTQRKTKADLQRELAAVERELNQVRATMNHYRNLEPEVERLKRTLDMERRQPRVSETELERRVRLLEGWVDRLIDGRVAD